jgi:peptidoglycan hydrolase CwlO-like protein
LQSKLEKSEKRLLEKDLEASQLVKELDEADKAFDDSQDDIEKLKTQLKAVNKQLAATE